MVARLTEYKAFPEGHKPSKRLQFSNDEIEILRAELQILLNKENNREALTLIAPPIDENHHSPEFPLGMFVKLNREWVIAEIRRRLPGYSKARIRGALSEISRIMEALVKRDETVSILLYTSEKYRTQLAQQLEAKCLPRSVGHPFNPPKRGKKRKVVIVHEGKHERFDSITEAAKKTGYGYGFIKHNSMKAYQEENQL